MGYDSIQMARPHMACVKARCLENARSINPSELVLCTGGCMTKPVTDACPPGVQMKRAAPGDGPCACPKGADVLSCGEGAPAFGRPYEGNQSCPWHLSSPEAYEFLQLIMDRALLKPAIRLERQRIREILEAAGGQHAERWVNATMAAMRAQSRAASLHQNASTPEERLNADRATQAAVDLEIAAAFTATNESTAASDRTRRYL